MRDPGTAVVVIHDDSCGFCRAVARWVHRHDRRGRLMLTPIADVVEAHGVTLRRATLDREMHVVDAQGRVSRGFRAWRRIARELPILRPVWPLLWLPGVAMLGDVVYRWVAAHRHSIGGLGRCGTP